MLSTIRRRVVHTVVEAQFDPNAAIDGAMPRAVKCRDGVECSAPREGTGGYRGAVTGDRLFRVLTERGSCMPDSVVLSKDAL